MQNDINTHKLRAIISELTAEVQKISESHNGYSKILSGNSSLFSAGNKDKKELAKDYYRFASLLAATVSDMEGSLSALPEIILDADRHGEQDRIILCDALLTRYGEFKKAISLFMSQNEKLLTNERISPSDMRSPLSEFGYKLNYFEAFLKEQKP